MGYQHVCFSHGQESGPWGTKTRALAELAREAGWQVESLDYQGIADPRERTAKLVDYCRGLPGPPLLVGSSMGGFVAVSAADSVDVKGLFLLAPALYLPGYEAYLPTPLPSCPTEIVHGWHDDVVPWAGSARYGQQAGAGVYLVDSGHRLTEQLGQIGPHFTNFLARVAGDTGS